MKRTITFEKATITITRDGIVLGTFENQSLKDIQVEVQFLDEDNQPLPETVEIPKKQTYEYLTEDERLKRIGL